ncbi:MAG: dienelactone hydrolase family protein [Deltaproteobacteria bacterium]|nr:dienelactone hydrolase family protein [Deltaproteobacteria bacterium]
MSNAAILLSMMLTPATVLAGIDSRTIEYRGAGAVLEGYLAYPKAIRQKRPGVLIVPDWMGVAEPYKVIANKLADMGYVAFVADIYGKGVRPSNSQEAAEQASKYKSDRNLLRQRVLAGFEELKKNTDVDQDRMAAIGYCFGGTTVIELARAGTPVAGVVSFHGGLDSPSPADGKNIKGKVLILHGADDPLVPPKDVAAFQEEMRKGRVDWQMIYYGAAVHSFTQKNAGNDKSKGVAYNENADGRSWEAMKQFFKEIFNQ